MRRRLSLLAVVAGLTLAGCAPVDRPGGADPYAVEPVEGVFGGNVTGVRSLDPRTLELTLTPVNETGCTTAPQATVDEELDEAVYLTSTYTVRAQPCERQPLVTTATLAADLGARLLVIDSRAWAPAGGAFRLCDEQLGCDPQPAACDDESYRLALDVGDFPRNGRSWTAQACEVPWLVLDVDITASGCGAVGDNPESNPCLSGPRRVTRWVFEHAGPTWSTVGTLPAEGGCGSAPPEGLPRALCTALPPV